jgi:hypothetical protein
MEIGKYDFQSSNFVFNIYDVKNEYFWEFIQ